MSRPRPYSHQKAQRDAKAVEGNECFHCDAVVENAAAHHLDYFCEGGPSDLCNFVTFCIPCHRDYHAGKLKLDIWRF
jgi:hypothetical protein